MLGIENAIQTLTSRKNKVMRILVNRVSWASFAFANNQRPGHALSLFSGFGDGVRVLDGLQNERTHRGPSAFPALTQPIVKGLRNFDGDPNSHELILSQDRFGSARLFA
jgi:hypothetical protein